MKTLKTIVVILLFCFSELTAYSENVYGNHRSNTFNAYMPTDSIPQPDIHFEESVFDFGKISRSKHTKRTHSFVFENTGNAKLFVLHATSGCGCTIPKYTKDPVQPGKKGKVDVTFDAKGRPLGNFSKSVTVYINSVHSYVRIFVKGTVVE